LTRSLAGDSELVTVPTRAARAGTLRRVRPIDRIFAVYLVLAGAALVFPHRQVGWPLIAAAHIVLIATLLRLGPLAAALDTASRRAPRLARLVASWYPLVLVPPLYAELRVLNVAVWNGHYFDGIVLRWEQLIWGGQPSRDLAAAAPYLGLSEILHAAYLSYYIIIYGPPLLLYLRDKAAFEQGVFTLMLAFFVHYLFFVYFPVQGPRYVFPPPGGPIAQGKVYALAQHVLEAGSSRGAAFPSSHVGVSTAQCVVVARHLPRLLPVVALLTLGLALGAVYGGYHYATDAVAGFGLGLATALVAPRLRRKLEAAA
jgi:membrane-associated phospholipid phosphatase